MRKIFFLFSCVFLLLIYQASFAVTDKPQVFSYQLKNGLSLFVKVDKRAPVVVSQVWYKVGSSYEPNGLTGISHVLEHMMFEGTKNHPAGKFSRIIAKNGGQENAATSYDFTYYYQNLAADKLPIAFALEADRMQNLSIKEKAFQKEIKVVQEERKMRLNNNPIAMTVERFMATAFLANPYHHPIIGWRSDLRHLTDFEVKSWYQSWYAPNNAIVVVVGDVKPQQVFELAKKDFGPIAAHQLPVIKPHPTVKALGMRVVNVNLPAKVPFLIMGYNVPSVKTTHESWTPYALDLIEFILDGGESSRLPKYLIRGQQIASSINVTYNPFARLDTLFILSGIPTQGHSLKQLQHAFLTQIQQLQQHSVSLDELERIKTQLTAQKIYAQDSLTYQARLIGSLESVGLNWKIGENWIQQIDKITPAQIKQVAKTYLIKNRLTIAYLHPLGENQHE